jgi:hypothetical protein
MGGESNESRTKTFEFKTYDELRKMVNDFEEETNFRRCDVSIEIPFGDPEGVDCDVEELEKIENGE